MMYFLLILFFGSLLGITFMIGRKLGFNRARPIDAATAMCDKMGIDHNLARMKELSDAHPELGLKFYADLFSSLKKLYPEIKLHALGPPEIAHVCKLEGLSHTEVLTALKKAG